MNVSCVILLAAISLPTSVAAQLASGPGEVDVPGSGASWRQVIARRQTVCRRSVEKRESN